MFSQTVQDAFQRYATIWLTFSRQNDENDFGQIRENVQRLYELLGYPAPQFVLLRGPIQQIIFPRLIELMLQHGREETGSCQFDLVAESLAVRKEWMLIWKEALDSIDWDHPSSTMSIGPLLNDQIRDRIHEKLSVNLEIDITSGIGTERMKQIGKMAKTLHNPLTRINSVLIQTTRNAPIYRSFINRLPESWESRTKKRKGDGPSHAVIVPGDWIDTAEFYNLASYHFLHDQLKTRIADDLGKELNLWVDSLLAATSFLFFQNCCLVYLKPTEAFVDDRFRFHHPTKAAVRFIDGSEYHRWHGIPIPDDIVDNPKKLKSERIMNERNGEVRRALIEMYGFEKFIRHSFPRKVHEDEYGALYRHDLPEDEPIMVVKVTNSTPEPDGTHKEYFLRVPPTTRTAKQGVASFQLRDTEYDPTEES